jgi:hypothetical protein
MCHMEEARFLFLIKISIPVLHQWIRLFKLLFGWLYWLKKASTLCLEVEDYRSATQKLMMMFKATVKRKHENGSKFPRVHLPCHFAENMIDFGVIANVDSGAPGSNHKPNVKAPSQHTQMGAESFEVQTAQRYADNHIIDFTSDALHVNRAPITQGCPVSKDVLRGARLTFNINKGPEGNLNAVSFQRTSKSISQPYPQ